MGICCLCDAFGSLSRVIILTLTVAGVSAIGSSTINRFSVGSQDVLRRPANAPTLMPCLSDFIVADHTSRICCLWLQLPQLRCKWKLWYHWALPVEAGRRRHLHRIQQRGLGRRDPQSCPIDDHSGNISSLQWRRHGFIWIRMLPDLLGWLPRGPGVRGGTNLLGVGLHCVRQWLLHFRGWATALM